MKKVDRNYDPRVWMRLACLLFLAGAAGCGGSHMRTIDAAEALPYAPAYTPPSPQIFSLPNGLSVFLMEDKELPLVRGELYMPGGSIWESPEERGLTNVMGSLLRSGGAGARNPIQLDRELEKLAASVGSSFGAEQGSVTFSCLKEDLPAVFGIFADVVLRPRFDEGRIELLKVRSLEDIRRRVDNPTTIASIAFRQVLYGDTAYGFVLRSADVKAMNRRRIIDRYKKLVRPEGAILALSGRIDRVAAEELVQRFFGGWRGAGVPKDLTPPPIPSEPSPGIYFIKGPFKQATVYIGELGVPRLTPDWYDILVFNEVFGAGGSFGSRLMREIRSDRGLAYSVNGGINPALVRGINSIAFQTKAESVGETTARSLDVLEGLRKDGPAKVELGEAKFSIINSYVFKFDAPFDIVQRKAMQQLLAYPDDYDRTFIQRLTNVDARGVQEVAQKRWHPEKLVVVVVGDEKAYQSIRPLLDTELKGFQLKRAEFDEVMR